MSTSTETDVRLDTNNGEHDRFSHYVRREDANRAYVTGEEIVALCGKKWTPSRDPEKYPICPTCRDLLDFLSE